MVRIDKELNSLEVMIVVDHYAQRNIQDYRLEKGNGCIWSWRGSSSCPINEYFIFREGRLVDIQID